MNVTISIESLHRVKTVSNICLKTYGTAATRLEHQLAGGEDKWGTGPGKQSGLPMISCHPLSTMPSVYSHSVGFECCQVR